MGVDGLVRLRVQDVGPHTAARWAEGIDITLPEFVASALPIEADARARGDLVMSASAQADVGTVDTVRSLRAFTEDPPVSSRTPVSYRKVPGWMRSVIARAVGRAKRRRQNEWARFPQWPLDLSADAVADLAAVPRPRYPDHRTPVLLSHDIDSPEGLRNLVTSFLPLEEAAGARSSNYVVPCGYAIDHALLGTVQSRAHEVGIHGFDHANRTPFSTDDERKRRLDGARALAERYGAIGYRAPSLLRTRVLLRDLSSRYRYDSSIPTSGGLFPVPNNGCASARPFTIEGITEIPISMPRDGSLRFLGYSPSEISDLWIECAERIARSGGIVTLLTHCERRFSGNAAMLESYRRFLAFVSERQDRYRWSMPADLL